MNLDSERGPNPYAAPQVAAEKVVLPKRRYDAKYLRGWVILQCIVIAITLFAQFISIESIIVTGPVFGLIGIGIVIVAARAQRVFGILFGASAIAFTLFIFLLINIAAWGPSDARRPVIIMSWIFAVGILPLIRSLMIRDGDFEPPA